MVKGSGVGVTTAANAGVGEEKAGLAAGLLNTGQQVGTALGLAILSAVATAHTHALLRGGQETLAQAATQGYGRALLAGAGIVLAGAAVALLAPNTRRTEPVPEEEPEDDAVVGTLVRKARDLAAEHGLAERGFRLVFNCGEDAGYSVYHIHLLLVGGRTLAWPPG